MKLSENIQRVLNALAYANAGDYLSRTQKETALRGTPMRVLADQDIAPPQASRERAQVALYLGSELPDDVMQYVIRTCSRLRHGLTVMTFQAESDAEALLNPYRATLREAGVDLQLDVMSGDPMQGLKQALRRRPEVAFLVCNESGYLSRGLMNGTYNGLPVPVVMVSRTGDTSGHTAGQSIRTA
jgi:hypothetical protein